MHTLAFLFVQALVAWGQTAPTEYKVRMLLGAMECGTSPARQWLLEYGDSAFTAYESILSNPQSKPVDIARTLQLISDLRCNRAVFVRFAVHNLISDDARVRCQAAYLVEQIGSTQEGVLLVALLGDRDISVAMAAAQALAAKGGTRELAAMELWLRTADFENRKSLHKHAVKHRDAFKKRLDDEAKRVFDGSNR